MCLLWSLMLRYMQSQIPATIFNLSIDLVNLYIVFFLAVCFVYGTRSVGTNDEVEWFKKGVKE
jgi:hypothetical protein